MNTKEVKATNTDRDEGSSVVVEERQKLKEMRAKSAEKESCIIFYCKECKGIVSAKKHPKRYAFDCNMCKSKQVAFGSEVSIRKFFRLKDDQGPVTEEEYKKRMEDDAKFAKEKAARRAARDEKAPKERLKK